MNLDFIADALLTVFADLGFDKPYIQEKEETLKNKDRFEVLLWCNNLDSKCRDALAHKLNVNPDEFAITLKTLTKL